MRAFPLIALIIAACSNGTGPGNCFRVEGTFTSTPPDFVARVSKIGYESGPTPSGAEMAQYAVWVTVAPNTSPNAGILLSKSTPVFERTLVGSVRTVAACTINVGDMLDVWHDNTWALGTVEAPPGDTLYFPTQVLIR